MSNSASGCGRDQPPEESGVSASGAARRWLLIRGRALSSAGRRIDDLRLLQIRDAYLEPFTSLGSREELRRWVALARCTGCVTRAISWESALQDALASVVVGEEFPVRGWLLELIEPWAADVG